MRQGLAEAGVPCEFYHGDLDASARQRVHSSWVEGRISVVVATVAFGMGINKSLAMIIPPVSIHALSETILIWPCFDKPRSDVRFVVHAGLPASLHHYYQEAGRAGRDGKPALCLLLYRPSDVPRHSVMTLAQHFRIYIYIYIYMYIFLFYFCANYI